MKEAKRNRVSSFFGIVIFLAVLFAAGCSLPVNQPDGSSGPENRSIGGPVIDPSAPNLAAYWKFDQNLLDATANHNNGTITGPSSWAEGVEDKGITLSGTNNYVTCPDSTSLNIRGNITIEAWINTASAQDEEICAKYRTTNPWAGYALKIVNGRLSFWFGGTSWTLSTGTVNDGNWHHVAVTGNGNAGAFYIDGSVSGTFAFTAIAGNAGSPLYLGSYQGGGCFSGNIDELAIWNRALTAVEIKNCYNSFSPPHNKIFIAGYYDDGEKLIPCYWNGMEKIDLSKEEGLAKAIFVSGNTVYTAGINGGTCYWEGRTKNILPGNSAIANAIYIADGLVYTAGQYTPYKTSACFWIGQGQPTYLPSDNVGRAYSIFVTYGIPYTAGTCTKFESTYDIACYWKGTIRKILTPDGNGVATGITVSGAGLERRGVGVKYS